MDAAEPIVEILGNAICSWRKARWSGGILRPWNADSKRESRTSAQDDSALDRCVSREALNVRPGPSAVGREVTVRFRTFRKHRRPCGQPAVVGEIECFRPVPPQAGHSVRIKATSSDLPFKSTGFAMYPEPPQLGQSSGSTALPLRLRGIVHEIGAGCVKDSFVLRNPNKTTARAACFTMRIFSSH